MVGEAPMPRVYFDSTVYLALLLGDRGRADQLKILQARRYAHLPAATDPPSELPFEEGGRD